jgi:hypothetical protein
MHFGTVDFPKELVESRATGDLVIFAGAGVSKPEPSNLPDFEELANELAAETTKREKGESLDRFLGRLDKDLRIHERTQTRLSKPNSRPPTVRIRVGLSHLVPGKSPNGSVNAVPPRADR